MQRVLHHIERHVGTRYLNSEYDKVDIIEKVEIDMPDIEDDRRVAPGESDAHPCDVSPAVGLYWRLAVGGH
jgi:hypothetical protein